MTIQKTYSLETVGGVPLAAGEPAADGAGVKRTTENVDGLGLDLLDALTLLAQDNVTHGWVPCPRYGRPCGPDWLSSKTQVGRG